ncbi:hypothetical protein THRCLA_03291 [Thraustotheca clavata]|uniref:Uncharacterized protein n=1 Tax=Thraustotheca clavata TaxID=74557 RepID=A0A1W0A2S5_9STRA|nr:hypothetical protein THRCLA_03291 [Thraustotheca clavata]
MTSGKRVRPAKNPSKALVYVYDKPLYKYLLESNDLGYLENVFPVFEKISWWKDGKWIEIAFVPCLYRLSMSWCYRATRFTHAVVALVTANAYISTLGGGYFLCRHLNQAKLMAQLQICVSQGLQDPILASKCRVNLAYGAMAQGKFNRAAKILLKEKENAQKLNSEDLHNVLHAAQVYLKKTIVLHKELLQHQETDTRRVVDEYYRQRVVQTES